MPDKPEYVVIWMYDKYEFIAPWRCEVRLDGVTLFQSEPHDDEFILEAEANQFIAQHIKENTTP